jgi:hypothetical protein
VADSECAVGLNCVDGDVTTGEVHGCLGTLTAGQRICYVPDVTELRKTSSADGVCTEGSPCSLCEGGCSESAQCAGGLHCFIRSADGLEAIPGCQDGGEAGEGYCAAPSNYVQMSSFERVQDDGSVSTSDDCTPDEPCGLCQADCDNDSQCAGNLICFQRDGLTPVPGCSGEGKPNADYCINPQQVLSLRDSASNACSTTNKCDICAGECTNNDDCTGSLTCVTHAAGGDLPLCLGQGTLGISYCYAEPDAPITNTAGSNDCSKAEPCDMCHGDCDDNSHCGPGLVCYQRDGNAEFDGGWCAMDDASSGRDYCVPVTNPALTYDSDPVAENSKYLGICEGDCLADGASCAHGLMCMEGDGSGVFSGCSGTSVDGKGYCYDATSFLEVVTGECTDEIPCHLCEGNCSSNAECAAGLECFTRTDQELVPGCKGMGNSGVGYCHAPSHTIMDLGDCNNDDRKCGLCQGDCDNDGQCADGLRCFQRNSANPFDAVPGCAGVGTSQRDYCYKPTLCYEDGYPWSAEGAFERRCNFKELADYADELVDDNGEPLELFQNGECINSVEQELTLLLGLSTQDEAEAKIRAWCMTAYGHWTTDGAFPFTNILNEGELFDKEFYDGNTVLNDERETIVEYKYKMHELDEDFERIDTMRDTDAKTRAMSWPDYTSNFANCELQSINCCWVQDRQANDANGNCATPYDENCLDANPADNVDVCYVDMTKAPGSSRVEGGFAIYENNDEDDSHCHGFAWSSDDSFENSLYRANALFFISMYDHFHNRGYVREVPGAPMCACLEQMPVVSRSDCTEIDATETVAFTFDMASRTFTFEITETDLRFKSCRAENNNDLASYYQKLLDEGHVTQELKDRFDQIIVGDDNCPAAIESFLASKGITAVAESA